MLKNRNEITSFEALLGVPKQGEYLSFLVVSQKMEEYKNEFCYLKLLSGYYHYFQEPVVLFTSLDTSLSMMVPIESIYKKNTLLI